MAVETTALEPLQVEELKRRLQEANFEFEPLQHAHFRARGPQVVVSAYRSGKVVIQGAGITGFQDRYLGDLGLPSGKEAPGSGLPEGPLIGTDEAGKGDYFGPLAVAGVALEAGREEPLRHIGVRDCKNMSDQSVLRVDLAIRECFPHALVILEPEEYNRLHETKGNLNEILAEAHADVIADLRRRIPALNRVLVDRFARESLILDALASRKVEADVIQRTRAEGNITVAAASIVARAAFLRSLDRLSETMCVDLPKGGSRPAIIEAGRSILEIHGRDGLTRAAKVHFKTTEKLI